MRLPTLRPELPSGGCAATCHTRHFCGSLIPSACHSSICLPRRRAGLPLPGCRPAPRRGSRRAAPRCPRAPSAPRSTAGRTRQRLHRAATAATDPHLNFRIIWAVAEPGRLPAHGSSILFDLEDSVHRCQAVNFNFSAELQCCFSSLSLLYLSLKDTGMEKSNWCGGGGYAVAGGCEHSFRGTRGAQDALGAQGTAGGSAPTFKVTGNKHHVRPRASSTT